MKFLHTVDWYIGQLLHEYDYSYEHQKSLNWLIINLLAAKINILLISSNALTASKSTDVGGGFT